MLGFQSLFLQEHKLEKISPWELELCVGGDQVPRVIEFQVTMIKGYLILVSPGMSVHYLAQLSFFVELRSKEAQPTMRISRKQWIGPLIC